MMASLARRERRPLWGILTFLCLAAVGFSLWAAMNGRDEAMRQASRDAELAAQTELAPLLQARDLSTPMTSTRARELASGIESSIVAVSPIQDVRIFSSAGRILYASETKYIGTRPSYLRDLVLGVADGTSTSAVREGFLQTYVPVWMNPNGDVAVAELSQPVGPISAEGTADWIRLAAIAGLLMLAGLAMVVVTSRAPAARPAPVQVYTSTVMRHVPRDHQPISADAPLYEHAGFRDLEEARREAERRAYAIEENFRAVQTRLKDSLAQVKELEEKLAMNETQATTNDGELQALRDQLRETSERLHKADLDNNALRERMALRQQELDEARRLLAEVRRRVDADELRSRLAAADELAATLERRIDQLGGQLEHANAAVHTNGSSTALRDLDDDDLEIEEEDNLFEHPMIIRNAPGHSTTPQKVR